MKRFKADVDPEHRLEIVQLPKEIIKNIIEYLEAPGLSLMIVSARFFSEIFSENDWMRLYAGRWKRICVSSPQDFIKIRVAGRYDLPQFFKLTKVRWSGPQKFKSPKLATIRFI